MNPYTLLLLSIFVLASCASVPEKVKANKEKFIQVAKENSQPIDVDHLSDIYEQAQSNNTEGKMKYLGVDKIETTYELNKRSGINLDSVVVFTKSDFKIIYDFATMERPTETIEQNCGLTNFQKIDQRLYIGQK